MNKYLIIVDVQNDFVSGSLGTQEAQAIIPRIVDRITKAKEEGWEIILTQDTHYDYYPNTQEGEKLPVLHCQFGTEGQRFHPDILSALKEYPVVVYNKETFGSVYLAEDIHAGVVNGDLEQKDYSIEIVGLCTNICVLSNAVLLKAYLPEAHISVNASCCAGVTPEMHEAALKVMQSCLIDII